MSAPAHTQSSAGEAIAVPARAQAALDRLLPFLGPALALVLGLVALGHRSLDADEAATVAAAQGAFSDVVERALSDDPARAGYLALLQPVVARNDAELWIRLPSVLATVVAAIAVYRLGRRLAGRQAGAAASIVLALTVGVVEISRAVGPLALALAAMLLSSALFARAVERGNAVWWAVYAVSAALLPLTHPIAASALVAQLAALVVARRVVDLRLAIPAAGVAVLESSLFLAAGVLDRADAVDGAGPLELGDIAVGMGRGLGWNAIVAALGVWGLITLHRRSEGRDGAWKVVLVGCLALVPLAAVLAAGVVLPVYPRTALVVCAGGASLAAGIGLVAVPGARERIAVAAAAGVVGIATLAAAAVRDPAEDWRRAAELVRVGSTPRGTVVVLPERARAAFAYYAPEARMSLVGRGDGVLVVVAGEPATATATARSVVSPPRYALLSQEPAGTGLVVQRWVRPGD